MRKKILFRIGSLQGGGAEKSLVTLLKYLDHSKYEIDLLLNCKSGVYLDQLSREVNLYYIGKGNEFLSRIFILRFLQKVWRLIRHDFYKFFPHFLYIFKLKNKGYDVEISFIHTIIPQLIKSPLKSKKVGWIHSDLEANYYDRIRKVILSSLKRMDIVIAVSKESRDVLLSLSPDLKNKARIIYNPIEIEKTIRKSRDIIIEKKGKKLQLITVGRLDIPQKKINRLINVCHRLRQEEIDFKLSILGEGPDRNKLASQIRTLRLGDIVQLLGYQKNPYPYIQAADIFVLPSQAEGMSYVVLEALILNKPIISTDVVGPRELLKNGECGLLVENSEEGLYQGIKRMLRDQTLRISFARKKKDFSSFEPRYIARQVEEIIDHL
ncbi:MAG: glycosyltransferase [Flavobacteriales bacterium AspAUS03]